MHGRQEGSAYNGHFETVCYHPLFLFNDQGYCLGAMLRPGNVHSADDWDELLVLEIEQQQAEGKRVAFCADTAFAKPEIYGVAVVPGLRFLEIVRFPQPTKSVFCRHCRGSIFIRTAPRVHAGRRFVAHCIMLRS